MADTPSDGCGQGRTGRSDPGDQGQPEQPLRPTFGSLFAGIGGIDLGLERAGWECRFQVEWDDYCQRVLAKHWPDVPRYGDITAVDWSGVERVDLLAGGFPCQPFSVAGRRRGIEDDRWLWPEFARAIRELRPGLVLVENVPGLLAGHGGMGRVLGDLATLGYDAEWDSIPAAAVGAPHLRYRVWIVAYRTGLGRTVADADRVRRGGWSGVFRAGWRRDSPHRGVWQPVAHTDNPRSQGPRRLDPVGPGAHQRATGPGGRSVAGAWLPEPDVGRVANGVPDRVDRLRGLGNAVVPQVAEVWGRHLMEML